MEHEVDIRAVLPTIQVPTLVINRAGDRVADLEEGRWLAGQIPGATFVELPGADHPPRAGDQRAVVEAISSFLGVRRQPAEIDGVLATVLLTDIVDSTEKAAELGETDWKDLLAAHDERVKVERSPIMQGSWSMPPATESSRRSTDLRGRCGVRGP